MSSSWFDQRDSVVCVCGARSIPRERRVVARARRSRVWQCSLDRHQARSCTPTSMAPRHQAVSACRSQSGPADREWWPEPGDGVRASQGRTRRTSASRSVQAPPHVRARSQHDGATRQPAWSHSFDRCHVAREARPDQRHGIARRSSDDRRRARPRSPHVRAPRAWRRHVRYDARRTRSDRWCIVARRRSRS